MNHNCKDIDQASGYPVVLEKSCWRTLGHCTKKQSPWRTMVNHYTRTMVELDVWQNGWGYTYSLAHLCFCSLSVHLSPSHPHMFLQYLGSLSKNASFLQIPYIFPRLSLSAPRENTSLCFSSGHFTLHLHPLPSADNWLSCFIKS